MSNCFFDVQAILSQKELSQLDKQKEIEKYLFESKNVYTNTNNPKFNFSSPTAKWLVEKKVLIKVYLNNLLNDHAEMPLDDIAKLSLIKKTLHIVVR